MCNPVAMMWVSMATTAVSTYAQMETAKSTAESIEVQEENERNEAKDIAEEELGVRVREAREKRGRARVAAGESGALGNSFTAAINQSIQDQDEMAAKISKNLAFAQTGISDRANTALAGIQSPSALEAGLSIGSAGAQGFDAGIGLEQRRKDRAEGQA